MVALRMDTPGHRLLREVEQSVHRRVVGQDETIRGLLIALLTGGHVLLEGLPGLAKTLLVRSLADALHTSFRRIQFTPDLLPGDVVGTPVYHQGTGEFRVYKGPVFANLLLADEVNRAPPKVQSALLEAMEEEQVTIDGTTYPLPSPFIVLATQNPIEYEGTFPLPEAELDRFILRVHLGYPTPFDEVAIMEAQQIQHPIDALEQVTDENEIVNMQRAVREVYVDPLIKEYIATVVDQTRKHESVYLGASPRGSLALYRTCQAYALLAGREFVTPDDVKELAYATLGHRLIVSPSARVKEVAAADVVSGCLQRVPVPGARPDWARTPTR